MVLSFFPLSFVFELGGIVRFPLWVWPFSCQVSCVYVVYAYVCCRFEPGGAFILIVGVAFVAFLSRCGGLILRDMFWVGSRVLYLWSPFV